MFSFKFSKKSKLVENAISVSAEKIMAPILIPIPKFNPGFGSRYQYQILVADYNPPAHFKF
jgi:hypothetical protein